MKKINLPYIFVTGNEKGGAGKTTCSIHLIVSLLYNNLRVSAIDVDCRQSSLSRYLENREKYNSLNPENKVPTPKRYLLKESNLDSIIEKNNDEHQMFVEILNKAKEESDVIVIDTPGTFSNYSSIAHSYADTVITPINDSFIDLDVIAIIDKDLSVVKPSIYSQMVWEQKLKRAQRDQSSIDWIIVRNRLTNIDAKNKRNISHVVSELQKRLRFKLASGFTERVIFRELFLAGLTLLDLKNASNVKDFSLSHVAARQELRNFLDEINIKEIIDAKNLQYT